MQRRQTLIVLVDDDTPASRRVTLGAGGVGLLAKPFEGSALLN